MPRNIGASQLDGIDIGASQSFIITYVDMAATGTGTGGGTCIMTLARWRRLVHEGMLDTADFQWSTDTLQVKDGGITHDSTDGVHQDVNTDASPSFVDLTATGTIRADTAFNLNGTDGVSSTLTLDDGANWRITMTFTGGILTAKTTAASSGAAATWS